MRFVLGRRGLFVSAPFQPFFKGTQAVEEVSDLVLYVKEMRRELLRQVAIVSDKQNRAGIVHQRGLESFP